MKCSQLFRFHTVVVQLLFIGILASFNFALASLDASDIANIRGQQPAITDPCLQANDLVSKAQQAMHCEPGEDQRTCKERLIKCQNVSAEAGADTLEDGEDSTPDNVCPKSMDANKKCGYRAVPPRDQIQRELDDENRSRKETIKECNDLTKEASKERTQNADAANKTNDNNLKSSKEYSQQKLDISKQMRDALTGMNDAQAKAAADGLQKADQLRQAGMKLQEELSRKVDQKNTTYVKWQTACLAAAEDARQKVEDDFDKYMAEAAKVKKNYSFSSLTGLRLRMLKQKLKKERYSYGDMKAKCMMGTKGPGPELKVAYDSAARDVNTSSVNYKNQTAEIQRQDQVNQMQLEQAKQQNFQKYQQAMGDLQQRSQQLDTDHRDEAMNEAQKNARDQQTMSQNNKETQDNIDKCHKELDASQNKIAGLNVMLNQCGAKTESQGRESDKAMEDGISAINSYQAACKAAARCAPTSCSQRHTVLSLENDCATDVNISFAVPMPDGVTTCSGQPPAVVPSTPTPSPRAALPATFMVTPPDPNNLLGLPNVPNANLPAGAISPPPPVNSGGPAR